MKGEKNEIVLKKRLRDTKKENFRSGAKLNMNQRVGKVGEKVEAETEMLHVKADQTPCEWPPASYFPPIKICHSSAWGGLDI